MRHNRYRIKQPLVASRVSTHRGLSGQRLEPGLLRKISPRRIAQLLLGLTPAIAWATTESFSGSWTATGTTGVPTIPSPAGTNKTSFTAYNGSGPYNYALYSFTVTMSGIYTAASTTVDDLAASRFDQENQERDRHLIFNGSVDIHNVAPSQ